MSVHPWRMAFRYVYAASFVRVLQLGCTASVRRPDFPNDGRGVGWTVFKRIFYSYVHTVHAERTSHGDGWPSMVRNILKKCNAKDVFYLEDNPSRLPFYRQNANRNHKAI